MNKEKSRKQVNNFATDDRLGDDERRAETTDAGDIFLLIGDLEERCASRRLQSRSPRRSTARFDQELTLFAAVSAVFRLVSTAAFIQSLKFSGGPSLDKNCCRCRWTLLNTPSASSRGFSGSFALQFQVQPVEETHPSCPGSPMDLSSSESRTSTSLGWTLSLHIRHVFPTLMGGASPHFSFIPYLVIAKSISSVG